jgi:hypothetical protein
MIKHFLYTLTFTLLISCSQNNNQQQEQQGNPTSDDSIAIINDPQNNLNIQTNSFSEIDSSGVLVFPLSMGESERNGGSLSYKEMPSNSYWNIIFFNSNTSEYHLLSERKMLISSYNYKYSSNDNDYIDIAQTRKLIFYTVTSEDYNKDKMLTNEDPEYLFVTDKEGNNFRQISPANYDLNNWQFIKSSSKVIMTVKKDSDKNNKFDYKDEISTFEIDLEKGTEAKEIFTPEFKNKMKLLFDRDWKRLKK